MDGTKCAMYDEVSVGNPGKVPYCTEQNIIEPDCQHCKRPYVTNSDKIRAMTDEELAVLLEGCICPKDPCPDIDRDTPTDKKRCTKCWLEWLKQEKEP